MASVRIVIVNYRTPVLTVDCLRSLAPEVAGLGECRVIVVEGGSGDGSAEHLAATIQKEGWADWIKLLPLRDNRGFAAGNNAALRTLLGSPGPPGFVVLLNPDTIVRPGAIRTLIEFMLANDRVGIAGSRLEDPDGTPQRSAFRFPSIASEFEAGIRLGIVSKLLQKSLLAPPVQNYDHQTGWVAGASVIIRRQVFESIGLLDEEYFLYYEETDFCLRAKRAGWECWYVPASRVVHLVGQSSGVTDPKRPPRRLPRYWFDSWVKYFIKNHGWFYAFLTGIAHLSGVVLWRIRARLQRKPDRPQCFYIRDFIRSSLSFAWAEGK